MKDNDIYSEAMKDAAENYDHVADAIAEAVDEAKEATKKKIRLKPEIDKGAIVAFDTGYYRVCARFSNTVNLTGVFGSKPRIKGVPVTLMREAQDEWYAEWQKSETYMCM